MSSTKDLVLAQYQEYYSLIFTVCINTFVNDSLII